jgi:hypothetical protein
MTNENSIAARYPFLTIRLIAQLVRGCGQHPRGGRIVEVTAMGHVAASRLARPIALRWSKDETCFFVFRLQIHTRFCTARKK